MIMFTRPVSFLACSLLTCVLFAGCGPRDQEAEEAQPADAIEDRADATADLPAERTDTLMIEGQPEPVTLILFRGEDVPVVTYYPFGDFEPNVVSSSQGAGVHFVATFGGIPTEAATLRLFFPSRESGLNDPGELQILVEEPGGIAEIEGFEIEEANGTTPCPNPEHAWTVRPADGNTGFMCISDYEGRWYLVIASYPQEYGDGFEPRAEIILREVRWIGSGDPQDEPNV